MASFGRGSASTHDGPTETKVGKVTNIKPSTTRGMKRLNVVEKTGGRKTYQVDISYKEARDIERKKIYEMELYEKEDNSAARGGMQKRSTSLGSKTYLCDDAPTEYTGGHKPQFKSFGGKEDSTSSGRTKF